MVVALDPVGAAAEPIDILQHELRQPLGALLYGAELLANQDLAADLKQEILTLLQTEVHRMVLLLDELRAATVHAHAYLAVRPIAVDPRLLLTDAARLASLVGKRRIMLDLPSDLPHVLADPARTHQVLANLLCNAIKHTPATGEVRLTARVLPHAVEIAVIDTGGGIRPSALPGVFARYFRALDPDSPDVPGDGLGLAIVREIVEAQRGAIWVLSDGPGSGATVGFTIPRAG